MKFTLDKNFLLVQVAIVVIFYLLNTWLANRGSSHFNNKESISQYDMFTYVTGLQYGAPGSKLEPVSSEAKTIALLQRILFVVMVFGALSGARSDSSFSVPGFGFASGKSEA
jgi:hypothetical protein